jgi:hypothetical protein
LQLVSTHPFYSPFAKSILNTIPPSIDSAISDGDGDDDIVMGTACEELPTRASAGPETSPTNPDVDTVPLASTLRPYNIRDVPCDTCFGLVGDYSNF